MVNKYGSIPTEQFQLHYNQDIVTLSNKFNKHQSIK